MCAYNFGSNAAWATGHSAEAVALAQSGLALAQELEHALSLSIAYLFSLQVLHYVQDHVAAQARAELLIAIAEKHRFPQWMGSALVLSGVSRTAQGGTELGLKLIDDGLKAQRATGHVGISLMLFALAAESHLQVGNDARALELLAEAVAISEKSGVGWYRPEVVRLQAETMLQSRQITRDDAIARIEHAAWLAKGQGALALQWRSTTSLARLLHEDGRTDKAREHLTAACGVSAEGFDSAELDAARSLLQTMR